MNDNRVLQHLLLAPRQVTLLSLSSNLVSVSQSIVYCLEENYSTMSENYIGLKPYLFNFSSIFITQIVKVELDKIFFMHLYIILIEL